MKSKPCPICGGKCCVCPMQEGHWAAHCQSCWANTGWDYQNEQEALEAWNTRDNTELESCCQLLIKAGISTGHADNFTELVEECIANVVELRKSA